MSLFRYTLHNIVGHPLMEVLHLVGLGQWSEWVHDATLPADWASDTPKIMDAGER